MTIKEAMQKAVREGKPELPTLTPTTDHNRTILVSNIPTNFPKTGVREFKMTLGYVYNNTNDGNMAGKAVALDNHVIPAIYAAFNKAQHAEALAEAIGKIRSAMDRGLDLTPSIYGAIATLKAWKGVK